MLLIKDAKRVYTMANDKILENVDLLIEGNKLKQ